MLVVRERLHIAVKTGKMPLDLTCWHDVEPDQVAGEIEFVEGGIARRIAVGLDRWEQVLEAYVVVRKIDRCVCTHWGCGCGRRRSPLSVRCGRRVVIGVT